MRYINKFSFPDRDEGLRINASILESHWIADEGRYFSMRYRDFDKKSLTIHLVQEQQGYCCYCMRRLYRETTGVHRRNVTLEHVIPNNITLDEWSMHRASYQRYPSLRDECVTVIPKGVEIDVTYKFAMPPFPHFIAYDNLVASCDGQTLNDEGKEVGQHCCNNKRGDNYVEPLFYDSHVDDIITYARSGHIVCPEEYVEYLNEDYGVNIMSRFLNRVRLFWRYVAESDYSVEDINSAIANPILRRDIMDDVLPVADTGEWEFLGEERNWVIYAEYDWFFDYYRK